MPDSHRSRSKSPGGHSHRSKKSNSKSKSKSSHSRSSSRSSSRSGYAKEFGGSKRQPIVLAYAPPEKPVGGVGRGRGRGRGRGGGGVLVEKKTPGPPGQVQKSKSHGSRSSSRSGSQDGKKKKGEADSDKKSDKGKGAKKGEKKGGGRGGAGGGQKKDKKEEKDKEEKKKGHGSRSRSGSKSSRSRSSSSSSSSSSDEENSIYKAELKGLKVDLKELHDRAKQQQSSRGHQTHDKGGKENSDKHLKKLLHHPNVSNDLGPYANTRTVEFLMKKDKTRKYYPATKFTATSLIDPWDEMADKKPTKRIKKPKHKKSKDSKSSSSSSDDEAKEDKKEEKKEEQEEKEEDKDDKKDKEDKEAGDGAKKTPRHGPMPILEFDTTGEYWRGPVPFTELPKIRAQIREEYMANGSKKTESDYTRTKEDFHNLELDRIEEVKKSSRRNLTKTYNAYLTNTPGSKKALDECLQEVKTRLGDDWESSSDEEGRKTVREQAKKNMESEKRKQRSSRRSRSNSPNEGGKNRGRGHRDGSADSRGSRGGSGRGRRSRSNTPPGHEGSRKGSPARS